MERRSPTKRAAAATSTEQRVAILDARAEKLFERERYAEASRLYQEACGLEKQPNARAYFLGQIGICRYNLGDDRQALRSLRRSAQLFRPGEPEFMPDMCGFVHFHLGSILEYQGKIAQSLAARRTCEQYVETQEKDTKWMLYAGMSRNLESVGNHEEAIRYSQKAIQILSDDDPGLAYLYESMANNHLRLHEYNEAITYFSKVLELAPDFERRDEIYLNVAHCYDQITNDRMALETYEKILELKSITGKRENATWIYLKIAYAHFRLEQFEKSLLVTLEGLRRRPKNVQERAEIHGLLAANYCELGRYREAVAEGEKTLKLAKRFPNSNLLYFRLALAYQKLGDRKSFSKYRTLCKKLFPEDTWNGYLEKLA
jgi:tetratricopeptide (TPR) repeat protein